MFNILLGVTGSVATLKTQKLYESLGTIGNVRVIATKGGQYFLEKLTDWNPIHRISDSLFVDSDEWPTKYELGDPVLHIELRRWASCLVIAPLDANTLAKLHHGMCDNLLTCVYRAWDWNKPVFVAPAMNTMMWENDPTKEQIKALSQRNVHIISPVSKKLACNDVGVGAMAHTDDIADRVNRSLRWKFPLLPNACSGIPINHHPGAFGFHRRKNHHTGVDLYCQDGSIVRAVEDGVVVHIEVFTGPKLGHDWWEETYGVMVEGPSGVVNYGELNNPEGHLQIKVGAKVKRDQTIGCVKRVLFKDRHRPDIPGHSTSMLHLELYKHGTRDFADWHDVTKNPLLMDPTPYLIKAEDAPQVTFTWDNAEAKTAG